MRKLLYLSLFAVVFASPVIINSDNPNTVVKLTTTNVTSKIDVKILNKPHHLFIGRCNPNDEILHQENLILFNDGKSHVSANIRMNIDAAIYITCVNIYDETPDGKGGYPSYVAGGVGHNFIEFNVFTDYGKGFQFFVKIQGHYIKQNDEK
ncbi:uncharacterized protein [Diabrotica undecimpunctata]|uniref:uncharacterized protein n=1 Tax=Diabrotica undecimpunctata TaxID=50387 RepID=UPI003B6408E4